MGGRGAGRFRHDEIAPDTEKWCCTLGCDRRPTEGAGDDDVDSSSQGGVGSDLLRSAVGDGYSPVQSDKGDRTLQVFDPPGPGLEQHSLDLGQRRGYDQAGEPAPAAEIQEAARARVEVAQDLGKPVGVLEVVLDRSGPKKTELLALREGRDKGCPDGSLDQLSSPSAG